MNPVSPTRGAGALQPPLPEIAEPAPRTIPFPASRISDAEDEVIVATVDELWRALHQPVLTLHVEAE